MRLRVLHLCIRHSQMIHSYSFNQFSRLAPQFVWLLVTAEPLKGLRGRRGKRVSAPQQNDLFYATLSTHTHVPRTTAGRKTTTMATGENQQQWRRQASHCFVAAAFGVFIFASSSSFKQSPSCSSSNRRGCHLMPSSVGSIAGYE